jgi:hypothetical protein
MARTKVKFRNTSASQAGSHPQTPTEVWKIQNSTRERSNDRTNKRDRSPERPEPIVVPDATPVAAEPVASRSKSFDSSFEDDSSEEDSMKSDYARYVWIVTKQVQSSSGSLKSEQFVFGDYQKAQERAKDLVGKVEQDKEIKDDVGVWSRLFRLPFSEKTYDVQVSCRQFIVQ